MLNRYVQRGAICWSLARKIETDGWHEALIADLGDFIDDELADDIVGDIAGRLLDPTGLAALACGSALPSGRSAPWVEESLPSSSLGSDADDPRIATDEMR